MPPAKSDAFDDATTQLAARLKALAHPARLEIVRVLCQRGTCICGEIVDELPLAQATVSQHLRVLKEAGLVEGQIDGPAVCYCVDRAALVGLRRVLDEFFDTSISCC